MYKPFLHIHTHVRVRFEGAGAGREGSGWREMRGGLWVDTTNDEGQPEGITLRPRFLST